MQNPKEGLRLNKAISDTGFCSRREADRIITEGRVTINGKEAVLGDRVLSTDDVRVDGRKVKFKKEEDSIYIAFNKPRGITCTTDQHIEGNIIDYIRHPKRIFPIGRLDKASEGLIFLTSDGDIVNKILRAGNNHEKEYIVTVNKPITPNFIKKMGSGVPILNTVTNKCVVKQESETVFKIILTQGLNRQIRRMCQHLDYEVKKLKRTRIMNVSLGNIPLGKWRNLSKEELAEIMKMVANSSKTA
ncbi:23S rRNA pseudouridine(2604) synthase RluF [Pedobacter sp. SD-b]|uniref:Pseudouridine synthase n=1 Tax=Pedobacter segetis TaxID=2793069 RepID=A0ABS1BJW0_9SPHI|nr:23S rRNA pseudouridine(2604) synthase RluF [Pedobacter segetis]MBK0383178.1 23S rRNA pseudouridine(2604) synthase RluF [Pedobacter segetis]